MDNLYTDMSTRLILVQLLKGFGTLCKLVTHKLKFMNGIIDHGSLHLRNVDVFRKKLSNCEFYDRFSYDDRLQCRCHLPSPSKKKFMTHREGEESVGQC